MVVSDAALGLLKSNLKDRSQAVRITISNTSDEFETSTGVP